jgi:hypothetical protein
MLGLSDGDDEDAEDEDGVMGQTGQWSSQMPALTN